MRRTPWLIGIAGLSLGGLLAGCSTGADARGTASADPSAPGAIDWGPCDELAEQLDVFADLVGVPSPLDGYADRMQCATVPVPLDYDRPEGRTIDIAVSRLVPESTTTRVVLTNPGGPGIEGRTMPAALAASEMSGLVDRRIVVGVDPRGTGGSAPVSCPSLAMLDPTGYDGGTREEALAYAARIAEANRECVDRDREFFEQLTTRNVSRDLDRVREALGVDRTDYFGASWGTELGMQYVTDFPEALDRVLLDSVTDVHQVSSDALDDVTAAVVEHGDAIVLDEEGADDDVAFDEDVDDDVASDEDPVEDPSTDGAPTEEGAAPTPMYQPLSIEARTAFTCNAFQGAADPEAFWRDYQDRIAAYGDPAVARPQHPLSSELAGVSTCAGWPIDPTPIAVDATPVELQLVGHSLETVTPVIWAERAHETLGGSLFVVDDGLHASLAMGEDAADAVRFLVDGTPIG